MCMYSGMKSMIVATSCKHRARARGELTPKKASGTSRHGVNERAFLCGLGKGWRMEEAGGISGFFSLYKYDVFL